MRNVILFLGILLAYTFIYAGMSRYMSLTGWYAAPGGGGAHAKS